jgi:hypothetical protein
MKYYGTIFLCLSLCLQASDEQESARLARIKKRADAAKDFLRRKYNTPGYPRSLVVPSENASQENQYARIEEMKAVLAQKYSKKSLPNKLHAVVSHGRLQGVSTVQNNNLYTIIQDAYSPHHSKYQHYDRLCQCKRGSHVVDVLKSINNGYLPIPREAQELVVMNIVFWHENRQNALIFWNNFVQEYNIYCASSESISSQIAQHYNKPIKMNKDQR